jgi:ABC-2 type transport system ATP-binding protein
MIKVENLTKAFGPKLAVNDVSFTVERGEVLGFLGPNGAGKSTTMRMLTGFIPPTAGRISIGGFDMLENPIPAKRLMGYLPENAPSYSDMTVEGFLRFCAEVRGLSRDECRRAVGGAIEACFLQPVMYQTVDTLSKGYRHRTCLAQSIIHDPDVLVMDEPTDGLDPNQKHEIRTLIRRMGARKAIIFSTHILEEVEQACSRAIIIDRGRIVANGTPDELKRRSANAGAVSITIPGGVLEAVKARLGGIENAESVEVLSELPLRVRVRPKAQGAGLARAVVEAASAEHWQFDDIHTEEGRLDEVFRTITLPDHLKAGATGEARA